MVLLRSPHLMFPLLFSSSAWATAACSVSISSPACLRRRMFSLVKKTSTPTRLAERSCRLRFPQAHRGAQGSIDQAVSRGGCGSAHRRAIAHEIDTSIARLMKLKTESVDVIRSVNSMECETLLEMRYLTFLGWDQVAAQLNYSQDYIYHLHRKALALVRVPSS